MNEQAILEKMTDLMADRLSTNYHSIHWIKQFYREMAINELQTEKRRNGGMDINEDND